MKFKKALLPITAVSFAVLLSACEPTDGDVQSAVSNEVNKVNKAASDMMGAKVADTMKVELVSAKKISCKEAQGAPGYICDVEMTVKSPFAGQQTQTGPVRFVKGDSGWVVTDK